MLYINVQETYNLCAQIPYSDLTPTRFSDICIIMHPIAGVPLVILLSFIICVRAQANFGITSYWIDKSCPQDVGRAIDETREGASRIINRMITQEDDKYMQFLQENIARFSVIKDQDRDVVWGRFRRKYSELRIFHHR